MINKYYEVLRYTEDTKIEFEIKQRTHLKKFHWVELVTKRVHTCIKLNIESILKFTFEIRILYNLNTLQR